MKSKASSLNYIMKSLVSILIFCLTFTFNCKAQSLTTKLILTDQERHWCDSLKIDTSIIAGIRIQTDSSIIPFPFNIATVLDADVDIDSSVKQIPGFLLNATNENADNIVRSLYYDFKNKGYTIFSLVRNLGFGEKPDILGILKTFDKYQILKQVQTNGANWDIYNDSLLNLIKIFDQKYSLDLMGASDDWCEFKINKSPKSWLTLAKEAYKVCPDIVDQGSGSVKKLAKEMEESGRLYFWWD